MVKTVKDEWEELRQESQQSLLNYLRGDSEPDAYQKARVATSALSSYTRHEATESAREQTALAVARLLFSDTEDFQRYISASMPRLSLPEPAEGQ